MLSWLRTLSPAYPALVMATGVIAVACEQHGLRIAAEVFYILAAIAYIVLAVLFALRIARYPRVVGAELSRHATGFAFLTAVAATNVIGASSAVIHGWWDVAWVMWWISLPLLAVCLYVPLIAGIVREGASDFREGINGTWFLMTVAVESVALLAALLLSHEQHDLLALVALAAFGLGLLLYVIVMTLIFARWTFTQVEPSEIHPPAWVAAGAVAITTFAGSDLLTAATHIERLERLAPLVEGITLIAWATATFWFPIMVAIGVWRHAVRRVALTYDPSYWAMVFPLAMYSAATFALLGALRVEHLDLIPEIALAIAVAAWIVLAVGLLRHMLRGAAHQRSAAGQISR